MKVIGSLQGFAAMRVRIEEYLPEKGVVHKDLVEVIRERYEFQIFPRILPGAPILPILVFAGGKFTSDTESFGLFQLIAQDGGDVIAAVTTEQADMVLNDLAQTLDSALGYRFGSAQIAKSFLSNVVVEFDEALEKSITKLLKIADAINAARVGMPAFNVKRIAFGVGSVEEPADQLSMVEKADFLIERRAGSRYEENRYFCSAPLPTAAHLRLLEHIEAITLRDGN
jgi:hypothetical protein